MQTVNQSGRPKDLEKRARILQAAKAIFLKSGYHGTSMNQIAQEAGVTKLTVYNHFQDKVNLFICAITETCEETLCTKQFDLDTSADFYQTLFIVCSRALQIIYSPEALKLDHVLLELAAEQNPLALQFFEASHTRMENQLAEFFQKAAQLGFIQADDPIYQTELLLTLLLGVRHHKVLLGITAAPNTQELEQIIRDAINLFLLKYRN
ncbi:TPA: TetR/AcrR family transcriptional regulator [Acinetobacter baumannii]|uniref:TetR/AcrR family transcriptional regulator n=1 Tax=Acinetobacter calcoaceticus/baumannii complex TaxID=909768 RepID=UPI0003FB08CD|nr:MULTISPECIES: TetR/AcrR family transcriptional regulator [Acinetobacter calcoaceticus/baumannii complex]MCU4432767.1 TetR/AcrR family transcriptional regulator [Acinetobacter pittii]MCU4534131.1 TetR/AcrR family transcriptional regulator [Acinetobacter pittii]ODI93453.1 TetR family transcriptional regulator [Acinetobacter pittii]RSP33508.1 TetR/AcrR family transcriptional regulator [Acinetobacter baumannii]HBN5965125.1 TetR/AcrR family transcriptional regulator [Acinetobacter baumannii]